ncbi:hypothetical protein RFI_01029, partial [Reticulomyxa filosa]
IRIWDIETAKQLNVFNGHEHLITSVKYGSNELLNIILSGSSDKSVRLWDIRSGQQIQVFNGHTNTVWCVEYSPFVIKNISGNSNVICSGSSDNTIRFWDNRSNKNELYMIKGDNKEDNGICCLKYILLKKKGKTNVTYNLNLCYETKVFLFEKYFCLTLLFKKIEKAAFNLQNILSIVFSSLLIFLIGFFNIYLLLFLYGIEHSKQDKIKRTALGVIKNNIFS